MADSRARKHAQLSRLRNQLKKKNESLADQFEFKMYLLFHFKELKKPPAVFEVAEVMTVMTNNYEETILKGAKDNTYSLESSKELLDKDIVQLHASRWQPMRRDVIGSATDVDFFLWPRKDIDRIECLVFSRWKGDDLQPFKPLEVAYQVYSADYEKQLTCLVGQRNKSGLIVCNPDQDMFLFVDLHHMAKSNDVPVALFKLSSICIYLSQDKLMRWGAGTCDETLRRYVGT